MECAKDTAERNARRQVLIAEQERDRATAKMREEVEFYRSRSGDIAFRNTPPRENVQNVHFGNGESVFQRNLAASPIPPSSPVIRSAVPKLDVPMPQPIVLMGKLHRRVLFNSSKDKLWLDSGMSMNVVSLNKLVAWRSK